MMRAAKQFKPTIIVLLGDLLDCYSISSHLKSPARKQNFQSEIDAAKPLIRELDNFKAHTKVYISGNHERRLEAYLARNAPALHGMLAVPQALGLIGWQWVPYGQGWSYGSTMFIHDLERAGKYAVKQALADCGQSVVFGHTHRLDYTVEGTALGGTRYGCSLGWLGRREDIDYKNRVRVNRDWQLGFGLGYALGNMVHIQPIVMQDYTCVVEGKLLCG